MSTGRTEVGPLTDIHGYIAGAEVFPSQTNQPLDSKDVRFIYGCAFGVPALVALIGCVAVFWEEIRGWLA